MSAGVPTDGGAGAKALPVRGVCLGPQDSEEAGVAGAQGGSQEMLWDMERGTVHGTSQGWTFRR